VRAEEFFKEGRLEDALQSLSAELRDNPGDTKRRTFLFELLCFAGDYPRAEKQLEILSQGGPSSEMGALFYRGALHAQTMREELFRKRDYPKTASGGAKPKSISGSLNGTPFQSLSDADPRIGANLELFATGNYLWIPFDLLASVEVEPPRRARDLLWIPARVRTAPAFQGKEIGEALLPALEPFSGQHPDDAVRLGRMTDWQEDEDGVEIPVGQKMLLVDGEEFPFLEVRKLEFVVAEARGRSHASA
jgi:type VI secretion system protein ImpE